MASTDTWREKLPLIESDTYHDTIEGFRLLSRASVGFIKLLFLRLVFASAYIFSSPARMIIGLYDLFRWARRSATTRRELLPMYHHQLGQKTSYEKHL
jgi:hypothetical protein